MRKRYLEFLPALFLILWGTWIANPAWNTFADSSVFSYMGKIMPELWWGLIYLTAGLVQLILLFTSNLRLRQVSSITTVFILLSLTIFTAVGKYQSTAAITYFVFAVCEMFAYTEILSDIKEKGPC